MKNLTIDINNFCNLNCEFCYQNLDGSELSKDYILDVVDKHKDFDTIEIGGGEPFLYSNIIDLIMELSKRNKKINISTNGTLIPDSLLSLEDEIKDKTKIQVSLNASNKELYEKITGKDLFNDVLKNINKIKPKYQTNLSSAIYQENFKDVPYLINLANQLNLPIRLNLVIPKGKGKNVSLITERELDRLTGQLLVQYVLNKNIEFPLLHFNPRDREINCQAVADTYNRQKVGYCPADTNEKLYFSKDMNCNCQFLGIKED